MKSSLLAPVTPFWVKQRPTPIDATPEPKLGTGAPSPKVDPARSEIEPESDAPIGEKDLVAASLDAADLGLRKVRKTVAEIIGKVDAAIGNPDRRDEIGADIDGLKDELRATVEDAQFEGLNWLTLDFGQDLQDKMLPPAAGAPIVLISSGNAADGILTRAYGAFEDQDIGGYHLLSDAAAYGQDASREISISGEVENADLVGMRSALTSVAADLAMAGDRLDRARAPDADTSSPSPQSAAIGEEIDRLLASVARDALRAQALNILNGDERGLKRLLAG